MFLTQLTLTAEPKPDLWRLGAPLVWCDPIYGRLVVPVDFITDLASIPRLFRNLPWLDPNGLSRRPAVVHDFLYGSAFGRRYGKQFADSFLRSALVSEGTTERVAGSFFYAVHWFGQESWDADGLKLAR